jgi:FixJ family two-component response regulator
LTIGLPVSVIDDDISVRESLQPLIRCAGWLVETFASAQQFLDHPRVAVPLPGAWHFPSY